MGAGEEEAVDFVADFGGEAEQDALLCGVRCHVCGVYAARLRSGTEFESEEVF